MKVDTIPTDRDEFIVHLKVDRVLIQAAGIKGKVGNSVSLPMVKFISENSDDYVPSIWPNGVARGKQYLIVIVKNAINNMTDVRTDDGAPIYIHEITGPNDKVVISFETIASIHQQADTIALDSMLARAVKSNDPLITEYAIKKTARELTAIDPLFWFRRSIGKIIIAIQAAEKSTVNQKKIMETGFIELKKLCSFTEENRAKDALVISAIAKEVVNGNEVTKRQAVLSLATIIEDSCPDHGGRSMFYARRILTAEEIKSLIESIGKPKTVEDNVIVNWLQS